MTGVENLHSARRGFIHAGNIPGFHSYCDKRIGCGGDRVIGEYIRRRVEKERQEGERVNRAVRQPAGRLSSRRQIAQMFHEIARKSR